MEKFSRRTLKALGLNDEQIDAIVDLHHDVVDPVIAELDDAKEKLAKYSENGETVSKEDYDKLKGEYDTYKADIVAKETRTAKVEALRSLLKGVGISEKRLETVVKTYNLDEIELDKDGKIKDSDTRTESAKTEWADFIETTTTRGANIANPPANNGGKARSKDEIFKMENGKFVYSASERQDMLAKL